MGLRILSVLQTLMTAVLAHVQINNALTASIRIHVFVMTVSRVWIAPLKLMSAGPIRV